MTTTNNIFRNLDTAMNDLMKSTDKYCATNAINIAKIDGNLHNYTAWDSSSNITFHTATGVYVVNKYSIDTIYCWGDKVKLTMSHRSDRVVLAEDDVFADDVLKYIKDSIEAGRTYIDVRNARKVYREVHNLH